MIGALRSALRLADVSSDVINVVTGCPAHRHRHRPRPVGRGSARASVAPEHLRPALVRRSPIRTAPEGKSHDDVDLTSQGRSALTAARVTVAAAAVALLAAACSSGAPGSDNTSAGGSSASSGAEAATSRSRSCPRTSATRTSTPRARAARRRSRSSAARSRRSARPRRHRRRAGELHQHAHPAEGQRDRPVRQRPVGAVQLARPGEAAGIKIVTFDSDVNAECRDLFVNQATAEGIAKAQVDLISRADRRRRARSRSCRPRPTRRTRTPGST